eukprot:scaffold21491_cov37-Tisochrysis_lutea.AAC.1
MAGEASVGEARGGPGAKGGAPASTAPWAASAGPLGLRGPLTSESSTKLLYLVHMGEALCALPLRLQFPSGGIAWLTTTSQDQESKNSFLWIVPRH